MSDARFHNLKHGGIPRQLAEGIRARVFPGVNLMLSVVEIEPGSVGPGSGGPAGIGGVRFIAGGRRGT